MLYLSKIAILSLALGLLCNFSFASVLYDISLDTSGLISHPAGPFSVVVVFNDGEGYGDANNSIAINGINFGTGSALGGPFLFGGATGSLGTGIAITDSALFSIFSEGFIPGLQLSFGRPSAWEGHRKAIGRPSA